MALGDGIRRNIASVDPTERALLREALIARLGDLAFGDFNGDGKTDVFSPGRRR